jgi:hypothetical protein
MTRHRRGHEALFAHKDEPAPAIAAEDATAEVTDQPPVEDETVQVPIFPTAAQLTKVSDDWAIVRFTDIKCSAMFSVDRTQLLELGAAMIKCANSMPSGKQLERAERKLILP